MRIRTYKHMLEGPCLVIPATKTLNQYNLTMPEIVPEHVSASEKTNGAEGDQALTEVSPDGKETKTSSMT